MKKQTFRGKYYHQPKQPVNPPKYFMCMSGGGQTLFAIYPDYWKKSWGEKPILGYVWSSDEYWATYDAYDKGIIPRNDTIKPKPVRIQLT